MKITANALICDAMQCFSLEDVFLEPPGDGQLLIRTHYSGLSIGTEFALVRNKISWGPYPLCTGYMGTGVVEEVGSGVNGYQVGDRVYFRAGAGMVLKDGTPVSTVSGTHCNHIVITAEGPHGADHLPEGCDMETSSMFVMPAVGLNGVNMANPKAGQVVVIHGCGLIGMGALAACVHRGCEVIAVDMNARNLELAKYFGARHFVDVSRGNLDDAVKAIAPEGADMVFECTGLPQCIDPAIALCRLRGTFVWQGNYGDKPIAFLFMSAHARQLTMYFPCDDGLWPCRRAVLQNMATGALPWERLITHRIHYTEAAEAFRQINEGSLDVLGLTINWGEQ